MRNTDIECQKHILIIYEKRKSATRGKKSNFPLNFFPQIILFRASTYAREGLQVNERDFVIIS